MRVILSIAARRHLREIAIYIARDNKQRAITFVRELEESARDIGPFPKAFPVVAEHRGKEIRRKPHAAYLIFYHLETDHVVIDQILYAARDSEALITPPSFE